MAFEMIDIKNNKGIQAIRIPEKMKLNDDKAYLKKVGNALHIKPFHDPWQNLIESIESFTPDLMDSREQPDNQQRESIDGIYA